MNTVNNIFGIITLALSTVVLCPVPHTSAIELPDSVYLRLYPEVEIFGPDDIGRQEPIPQNIPTQNAPYIGTVVPKSGTIDRSLSVGEIPINSELSLSGAKTYSVPIKVPAGISEDMTPQISVSYNSHASSGIAGHGWNISGLSSITRQTKSIFYDGVVSGIAFNSEDAFSLDGVRLVEIQSSSTYNLYRTEEGNVMAKGYKSGNDISYFEVFYPNGNRGTFGYSGTYGRISFPETTIGDLQGNRITYTYTFSDETYLISKITYNNASLRFSYRANSGDKLYSFVNGKQVGSNMLVSSIECFAGSTEMGTYSFEYDEAPNHVYRNMAFLKEIGYSSNGSSLNPLKFYYGNSSNVTTSYSLVTLQGNWYTTKDAARVITNRCRFDYNGMADAIITYPYNITYWLDGNNIYKNKYTGEEEVFIYTGISKNDSNPTSQSSFKTGEGFVDLLCADLTGELEEKIIRINNTADVGNKKEKLSFSVYEYSALYGGAKDRYERTFYLNTLLGSGSKSYVTPKYYRTGDFDGDGREEVLAVSANKANSSKTSVCYIFDLEDNKLKFTQSLFEFEVAFIGSSEMDSEKAYKNTDRIYVIDYDGDGKHDIMHVSKTSTSIYTFSVSGGVWSSQKVCTLTSINRGTIVNRDFMQCDVNADGLTDFILSPLNDNKSTDWTIYTSKGNGQFIKSTASGVTNDGDAGCGFFFFDADGDGISDLVKYDAYGLYCYKCFRSGFDFKDMYYAVSMPNDWANTYCWIPANVNSRNSYPWILTLRDNVLHKHSFNLNSKMESLCIGMCNSLGVVEHNDYAMLNDTEGGVCHTSFGATFPYAYISEPLPLLAKETIYFDKAIADESSYIYMSPEVHVQGLGFLGFKRIERQNRRGQRYIRSFDTRKRGVPLSEISPESESVYTYSIKTLADGTIQKLNTATTSTDLLTGVTSTMTATYDDYGSPLTETTVFDAAKSKTVETKYSNNSSVDTGYYIGYPIESTQTVRYDGSVHVDKVVVTEHDKCRPFTVRLYSNGVLTDTETFTYNSMGLTLSNSVKKYSSDNTVTTRTYHDSYGRNIRTENRFGGVETRSYTDCGLVQTLIDARGSRTNYIYDSFGNETERSSDGQTPHTSTLSWCSENETGVYKKVDEEMGGKISTTVYDAFNREIRTAVKETDNYDYITDYSYDSYGNLKKKSLPYRIGKTQTMWIAYDYDSFNRIISTTEPSGKKTSYSYNLLERSISENGVDRMEVSDVFGNLVKVTDPSGSVVYKLNAHGRPSAITSPDGITTAFTYDTSGRLLSRTDPSHGTETYTYDNEGNISQIVNARGQTISYAHDKYGRKTKIVSPEMTIDYRYAYLQDDLLEAKSSNGYAHHASYDKYGHVVSTLDSINGYAYKKTATYTNGLLSGITHISTYSNGENELKVTESYSYVNGILSSVECDGVKVYGKSKLTTMGLPQEIEAGNMKTIYSYDEYGSLTGRRDTWGEETVSDVSLDFDPYNGNLLSRRDNPRMLLETFDYDGLNRLTDYGDDYVEYASNGNILKKSDAGTFGYASSIKPYALTQAIFSEASIPTREQAIEYTSFSRPASIKENNYIYSFEYGPEFNRVKMTEKYYRQYRMARYSLGDGFDCDNISMVAIAIPSIPEPLSYGVDGGVKPPSGGDIIRDSMIVGPAIPVDTEAYRVVRRVYIGGDAYTAPAVLVQSTNKSFGTKLLHIVRDHLGSIVALVDSEDGKILEENSYDAWGRMRNPDSHKLCGMDKTPNLILGRGYGGHEYLAKFGLVNMNARLYDPVLGRFLSPDPYVQDPGMPQNFNRYSYCLNNPLLYKDPSGEFFLIDDFIHGFWEGVFKGKNPFKTGWKYTRNSFNIWKGLFSFDTNKGWFMINEFLSRFTWQLPQTIVGLSYGHARNMAGQVKDVKSKYGVTVIQTYTMDSAVTIGNFIVGQKDLVPDPNNSTFQHEYGHYIQSQEMGPLYLLKVGIPSAINVKWGKDHEYQSYEVDANRRAFRYFLSLGINFKWYTVKNPFSKP
ncbi:MAG: hypothetical protein NC127_04490 [Muribaculum sp.]|nr:hypothetical protein [Muribaculum sp.]